MKIGIDSRVLCETGGLKKYAANLIKNLAEIDQKNEYVLFVKDIPRDICLPDNFKFVSRIFYKDTDSLLWEQFYLPLELKRLKIDVFHNLYNWGLPFFKPCKYILTLHDIIPFYFPSLYKDYPIYLSVQKNIWLSATRADFIVTISDFSKQDIMKQFKFSTKEVKRIYEGYDETLYRVVKDESCLNDLRERLGLKYPFVLHTGKFDPRKNVEGMLLTAFKLFKQQCHSDVKLVLTGELAAIKNTKRGCDIPELINKLGLKEEVIFLGFVKEEDLPLLYNAAEFTVYPSLYEGFGLPAVESMACGTPVIASNRTSLPEVIGDAGLLIDPLKPEELAVKMTVLFKDAALKNDLRKKGLNQCKKFSWKDAASEILRLYESVCNE